MDQLLKDYDAMMARGDPRVEGWPLAGHPWHGWLLVFGYLVTVWLLMKWMKNRKEPYEIGWLINTYNVGMIAANCYIFYHVATAVYELRYGFVCNTIYWDEKGLPLLWGMYVFYFSKYFEFCDTIFFVLRKKNELVTFLHVYHHASMPVIWWVGIRYAGGAEAYLGALINSVVHIIMYTYYMLAFFKIQVWWKRYLTQLQMSQFVCLLVQAAVSLYVPCNQYNLTMIKALLAYMVSMLVLFGNFYYQTYVEEKRKRSVAKATLAAGKAQ